MILNLNESSKLPLLKECISEILKHAKTPSKLQKSYVNSMVDEIHSFWQIIFGAKVLITKSAVRKRISKCLENYHMNVYKNGIKGNDEEKFYQSINEVMDLMKTPEAPEISKELRSFYNDQKTTRITVASDFQDFFVRKDLEEIPHTDHKYKIEELSDEVDSESRIDFSSSLIDQRTTRSGLTRFAFSKADSFTQVDDVPFTPRIRYQRNFTAKIKDTIALACVDAGITPNQSRKAFQSIAKNFFGAIYYLDIDEVPNKSQKRLITETEAETNYESPQKKLDFKDYEYVLPCYKTICTTKHVLAINQEKNLALSLLEKSEEIKITAHYDTTSRAYLKYEWTSLIFEFSNGQKFSAKPLPLGIENRESIVDFFYEQIHRLAEAANVEPKRIWEAIDCFMTDAVSKNLEVPKMIAQRLGSSHIPHHLLCNSHTCEAFDRGNLKVISKVEAAVRLKEHFISQLADLKSFLKSKTCTEAALSALTKLCCNDGHKSSQFDLFDAILAEHKRTRKFSILKERRFGILGYTAAAVLYHLSDIKELLKRTKSNNLLVRACEVYVSNDYLITCFKALAIFNYHVTLPFLNFNEKQSQAECVEIFPQLYKDLSEKKISTLKNFTVDFSFEIPSMDCSIVQYIIDQFCLQASEDFRRQKGREYNFEPEKEQRGTVLSALDKNQLDGLPTNNVVCERELGKVDYYLSTSSKTSPKNFEGLGKFLII